MTAVKHELTVPKTARFYSVGGGVEVKQIIIALHGYHQLATYFIRNFESIATEERLIIAPEGLHRAYITNNSGRVGASWMTKEDRLVDIADNLKYLDLLTAQLREQYPEADFQVLGFSQGVATASRWILKTQYSFSRFVAWSGTFPIEEEFRNGARLFNTPITACIGDNDEYSTVENYKAKEIDDLVSKGFDVEFSVFRGEHRIVAEHLKKSF